MQEKIPNYLFQQEKIHLKINKPKLLLQKYRQFYHAMIACEHQMLPLYNQSLELTQK